MHLTEHEYVQLKRNEMTGRETNQLKKRDSSQKTGGTSGQ